MILLQRLASSLQLGVDHFYDFIEGALVSKKALFKTRMGLNPEFVRKFADGIAEIQAQDANAPSYLGMRLIALTAQISHWKTAMS